MTQTPPRTFRPIPLALRVLSSMIACAAVFWTLDQPAPVLWATPFIGAAVWAGEWAAHTRVRAPIVVGFAVATLLLGGLLSHALHTFAFASEWLGTSRVASFSLFLLVSLAGGTVLGGLRWAAARLPALAALEATVFLVGLASVFAAHRHGDVLRPLWLSDWAWRRGLDPQTLLRGMGAASVVLWLGVFFVDARSRVRWALVPILALLASLPFVVDSVHDRSSSDLLSELGLTAETDGDRLPTDEGPAKDGDSSGGDEGGGSGQESSDDGDGGGGGQPGDAEAEGGGSGEADEGGGGGDGTSEEPSEGGGGASEDLEQLESPSGASPEMRPRAVVLLGDDFEPPMGSFYFRQDAWSRRQGPRLVPASSPSRDTDLMRLFPMLRTAPSALPPMSRRAVVHATVGILSTSAAPFALESTLALEPRPNPNPARFAHFYHFEAAPVIAEPSEFFGATLDNPAWSDEERAYYLAAPDDPRYLALAQEIVAELPKPSRADRWAQAVAVKLWMDREIVYSLRHRHAGARDPTADFLFGDRTGYCVHIAHAVVYLYRLLGIPARIGVGYMVPAEGRHGSTVVIMESDAHAWPELWIDGVGWVILDVAPEQMIGDGPPVAEPDLADLLADMAREVPAFDAVDDALGGTPRPTLGQILWGLLRLAAWMALLAVYLWKLWRRLAWRVIDPQRAAAAAWAAAIDQTFEAGRGRAWGESVYGWARRESAAMPSLDRLAAIVTERTYAAAPSDRCFDRDGFRRLYLDLDRELSAAVPWWRRLLGALDPTTPFRHRG